MAIIENPEQIEMYTEFYWHRVQKILKEVFDWNARESDMRIREIAKDLKRLKPEARTLFYHASPFDVAEDFHLEQIDPLIDDEDLMERRKLWMKKADDANLLDKII